MSKDRRTENEPRQVGDYFSGADRYYDQNFEVTIVKVRSGECYVTSRKNEMLVAIVGSCLAVCMRDPETGVGGMNHFLLPEPKDSKNKKLQNPSLYGSFAMEQLINEILRFGGKRERLEVKLFGGASFNNASNHMNGRQNITFINRFIESEGLSVTAQHLGGAIPRRIHYFPDTGKVMMRELHRDNDLRIVMEEQNYEDMLLKHPIEGKIELF